MSTSNDLASKMGRRRTKPADATPETAEPTVPAKKTTPKEAPKKRLTVDLPADTMKNLKMAAAARDTTIRELTIEALDNYVFSGKP